MWFLFFDAVGICRLPHNVVTRCTVIAVTVGRALAPDILTAEKRI